jgi:hypothetical protein
MTAGPRVLVLAVLLLHVGDADAQMPWPGESGAIPTMRAPRLVDGGAPPCIAEFARLRGEVKIKGMAVMAAAGRRHITREEMCSHIAIYAAAQANWIDFVETRVQTCGIPAGIVNELHKACTDTERTRVAICTGSDLSPLWPKVHMDDIPTADRGRVGRLRH